MLINLKTGKPQGVEGLTKLFREYELIKPIPENPLEYLGDEQLYYYATRYLQKFPETYHGGDLNFKKNCRVMKLSHYFEALPHGVKGYDLVKTWQDPEGNTHTEEKQVFLAGEVTSELIMEDTDREPCDIQYYVKKSFEVFERGPGLYHIADIDEDTTYQLRVNPC